MRVPHPIDYLGTPARECAIQSAVPGRSVSAILKQQMYRGDRKGVCRVLEELTHVNLSMRETCSLAIGHALHEIQGAYFENYLGIELGWDSSALWQRSDQVQHGDWTPGNILLDEGTNRWGILDWEWMATGYPLLFDLFSFFTAVRFVDTDARIRKEGDRHYESFIDTYFSRNWFSEKMMEMIESYCRHVQLGGESIFCNLTAYLVFKCNKYRLHYHLPAYKALYEKMLVYAATHKMSFVFNR